MGGLSLKYGLMEISPQWCASFSSSVVFSRSGSPAVIDDDGGGTFSIASVFYYCKI